MSIAGVRLRSGGFRNGQRCDSFRPNSHPGKLKVANLAAFKKFLYEKDYARRTQRLLDPFGVEKNFGSRGISIYRREALHYEFKPRGVYVTVVPPPLTNTAVLAKLGFDPRTMPMKPMSVEQCVSEGLNALRENRSRIVPGG